MITYMWGCIRSVAEGEIYLHGGTIKHTQRTKHKINGINHWLMNTVSLIEYILCVCKQCTQAISNQLENPLNQGDVNLHFRTKPIKTKSIKYGAPKIFLTHNN